MLSPHDESESALVGFSVVLADAFAIRAPPSKVRPPEGGFRSRTRNDDGSADVDWGFWMPSGVVADFRRNAAESLLGI